MSNHAHNRSRVPEGVTKGGEFATERRAEAAVTLAAPASGIQTSRERAEQDAQTIATWARQDVTAWADSRLDLKIDGLYPEQAASELASSVNSDVIAEEYYRPMTRAILDGREEEVDRLQVSLADRLEREHRWRADPDFVAPGADYSEQHAGGPVMYRTSVGDRYDKTQTDAAVIARKLRTDIKDAVRAGFLPDGIAASVRTSKYSGGQSIRIAVSGLRDDDIYRPVDDADPTFGRRYTASAQELRERVTALAEQYNHRTTSIETDYFANTYYAHVSLLDEADAEYERSQRAARTRKAPV